MHILNFSFISHLPDYHNIFCIIDRRKDNRYFDHFELHTIELDKFTNDDNEDYNSLASKIKTSLDPWVAFLSRHELLGKHRSQIDKNVSRALDVLDTINFTDAELDIYEAKLKWIRAEAAALEAVRLEGRLEDKEEERPQIAKNLLSNGLNVNAISSATGLTVLQIEALKE